MQTFGLPGVALELDEHFYFNTRVDSIIDLTKGLGKEVVYPWEIWAICSFWGRNFHWLNVAAVVTQPLGQGAFHTADLPRHT